MANSPALITVIVTPTQGLLRIAAVLLALSLGAHSMAAAAQLHAPRAAPSTIRLTTSGANPSATTTKTTLSTPASNPITTPVTTPTTTPVTTSVNTPATVTKPSTIKDEEEELRRFLRQTIASADSFNDRFDAEVWLVDMPARLRPFIKDPTDRLNFLRVLHREATASGLKPDLVLALIEVESGFDSYAVSRAGAQGLMQVMPFWKNEIGRPEDNLIDTQTNLSYGCRILQFYLNKERGNWMKALARYNGSYGKYWYSERVMDAWQARWLVR